MGKEVETRVIKPPIEKIVSGRIFKPDKAYTIKVLVKNLAIATSIWLVSMVSTIVLLYILYAIDPVEFGDAIASMGTWGVTMSNWLIIGNLIWLIPAEILTPIYINSIV